MSVTPARLHRRPEPGQSLAGRSHPSCWTEPLPQVRCRGLAGVCDAAAKYGHSGNDQAAERPDLAVDLHAVQQAMMSSFFGAVRVGMTGPPGDSQNRCPSSGAEDQRRAASRGAHPPVMADGALLLLHSEYPPINARASRYSWVSQTSDVAVTQLSGLGLVVAWEGT